jgi:hypothetical protein
MLDVLRNDEKASFFFIGAEDEKDEIGSSTRRFRVYRRFVSSTVSNRLFEHYRRNDLSLYILVNKKAVKEPYDYAEQIAKYVIEKYV